VEAERRQGPGQLGGLTSVALGESCEQRPSHDWLAPHEITIGQQGRRVTMLRAELDSDVGGSFDCGDSRGSSGPVN